MMSSKETKTRLIQFIESKLNDDIYDIKDLVTRFCNVLSNRDIRNIIYDIDSNILMKETKNDGSEINTST
jgi:hypothetical protein